MKTRSSNNSYHRGVSTLEILIAMSILILTLTAVTLTSFGGQSLAIDSRVAADALSEAQAMLERAQLTGRKDYQLVNPTTTVKTIGSITYREVLDVVAASDHATKKVTANISWIGEHGRRATTSLSTLVTNFDHAVGGNTCDSVLSGDWKNPIITNATVDLLSLIATSSGYNVITSVDAHKGKLYLTVGNTSYKTDPNFFIFDIAKLKTTPTAALLGKFDTAPTKTSGTGLFALHVAEGTTTGSMYAYVANEYAPSPSWSACAQGPACAQLQIIDVSSSTKLTLASTTNYKIPSSGITTPVTGTGGQAVGNSIFYKDGLVYLGLTKTGSGPEFNIIDVHNPLIPQWIGGYSVGASVYAISVVGNIAYLAVRDSSKEVIVLNVANPTTPTLLVSYDAPGAASFGYGESLMNVGDTLYLGRSYVNNAAEFLLLDASSSSTIKPYSASSPGYDIGTIASPYSVSGVFVRDYLAFLAGGSAAAGGKFAVLNVSSTTNVTSWGTPLALPSSSIGSALDCEGNDFFVSSNDASNNGFLSVITSSP